MGKYAGEQQQNKIKPHRQRRITLNKTSVDDSHTPCFIA
ncbi:hypothetical protein [Klebsiella pneumoniae IS53]|nr:hypothetical protein [Klebsiella pneumoniae IS53]